MGTRVRGVLFALVALVALLVAAGPARAADPVPWSPSRERELAGGLRESVFTAVRPPGGPFDVIALHRYRGPRAARAALLYLPGTHMNGELALTSEDHNLWLFLAARGVDVYALDYRTHAVPPDDDLDARFMKAWTLAVFVEDAIAASAHARRETPGVPLFVAGFSRGVQIGYAAAYGDSAPVAGLIALDGSFKQHRPGDPRPRQRAMDELEASGRYASDVAAGIGWAARRELMRRASEEPGGPATRGGVDAKTAGEELASVLYEAWRPGALANAREGYSDPQILARLLAGYDRYYPAVQNVDGQALRSASDDPESPLDDGWGETDLPILYIGSTGMGTRALLDGIYSADASGSRDVTVRVLEGYGHLDVLVGARAREEVFAPIQSWIEARLPADRPPASTP